MLDAFGETQKSLLKALYHCQDGLGSQDLVTRLGVTRTAVHQHLSSLSTLGYIEQGAAVATGGRPGQTFRLTLKGIELFPKQYTWFTELLLTSMAKREGDLAAWMDELGRNVAESVKPKLAGLEGENRLTAIVQVMNDLLYEAAVVKGPEGARVLATNCVYHGLAAKFTDVCRFDLALLTGLTGKAVTHEKCIIRGDGCCEFSFR